MNEIFRVGESEEWIEFGSIRGFALTQDGFLYVLDSAIPTIRVFDPMGNHVMDIGRVGEGPGEFRNPGGLVIASDQRIWVRDYPTRRYTIFDSDGEVLGLYTRPFGSLIWRAAPGGEAEVWEQAYVRDDMGQSLIPVLFRLEPEGSIMTLPDTIYLPPDPEPIHWQIVPREVASGIMEGGSILAPFAPKAVRAVDPMGGVWTGRTDELRFTHYTEEGGVSRVLDRLGRSSREITAHDVGVAVAPLWEAYGDALQVDEDVLPQYMPYWEAMFVDEAGDLWVQRFSTVDAEAEYAWEIYDGRDARFMGVISLPFSGAHGVAAGGGRLAGVATGEHGVQSIVVLEVGR